MSAPTGSTWHPADVVLAGGFKEDVERIEEFARSRDMPPSRVIVRLDDDSRVAAAARVVAGAAIGARAVQRFREGLGKQTDSDAERLTFDKFVAEVEIGGWNGTAVRELVVSGGDPEPFAHERLVSVLVNDKLQLGIAIEIDTPDFSVLAETDAELAAIVDLVRAPGADA